jgi:hypothetical protein
MLSKKLSRRKQKQQLVCGAHKSKDSLDDFFSTLKRTGKNNFWGCV